MLMLLNGARWQLNRSTERPELDSVEIWSLTNTTGDIHPIHLHLVRFQVLDRQSFDADEYLLSGKLNYRAHLLATSARRSRLEGHCADLDPETVTRIIVRFEGYTWAGTSGTATSGWSMPPMR